MIKFKELKDTYNNLLKIRETNASIRKSISNLESNSAVFTVRVKKSETDIETFTKETNENFKKLQEFTNATNVRLSNIEKSVLLLLCGTLLNSIFIGVLFFK